MATCDHPSCDRRAVTSDRFGRYCDRHGEESTGFVRHIHGSKV